MNDKMKKKTAQKSNVVNSLIIFVDVRGFTSWSEKTEVTQSLDKFGKGVQDTISSAFVQDEYFIKNLGDGAMIIKELQSSTDTKYLKSLLSETINKIHEVEKKFKKFCTQFGKDVGTKADLKLGWGITKGYITKCNNDYLGANINKSSRLCGIARPYGIVIDKDDFQDLPRLSSTLEYKFHTQKRILKGIASPIDVWVTTEIASQFITREHLRQTPEVHIAGICVKKEDEKIKVLISKRNKTRKIYPGLYEGCGGQLAYGENFTTGVVRHYHCEFGIEVRVIETVHKFYYIQYDMERVIPGIKFLCEYISGDAKSENHEKLTWVTYEELGQLPEEQFIPGLKNDFLEFMKKYQV
ncbi:hypothetical protein FACS189452_08430 [Bacteroidia bacterium]|nr:hypothetical protein FACS189452_08430 [Bacteroidia bacterium]